MQSNSVNLTEGEPRRLIFNFTMPLLATNIIHQLYGLIDMLIVGRFLGVEALAAMGASMSIMFLTICLIAGLTNGFTIVTGQYYGAGDFEKVKRSAATSVSLCGVISLIFGVLGAIFAQDILLFMNTPPEILAGATSFITVISLGMPFSIAQMLGTAMIRAVGDSKGAMRISVTSLIANCIFEPILIIGLGYGVGGAAMGIILSHILGFLYSVYYIERHIPELHAKRQHFTDVGELTLEHLRIGVPMAFQMSIIALGFFIVQIALNREGAAAVAGFAAAHRVDSVCLMPMMSFGIAISAFTAQNFGAGKKERILDGVRKTLQMTLAFAVVMGVIIIAFGAELVGIFVGNEPLVQAYGKEYLLVTGLSYWVLSVVFVCRNAFQGVGETLIPTISSIVELVMRGVAAFGLAPIWGFLGICLSQTLAWVGACLIIGISYYKMFVLDNFRNIKGRTAPALTK